MTGFGDFPRYMILAHCNCSTALVYLMIKNENISDMHFENWNFGLKQKICNSILGSL